MFFQIGDFLVGMAVGVLTALAVRAVMWPGIDMVIAMLIGMALGMIIHFVVAFAVGPLLGMFQTMMPASVIPSGNEMPGVPASVTSAMRSPFRSRGISSSTRDDSLCSWNEISFARMP